jgi:hypothetical protein
VGEVTEPAPATVGKDWTAIILAIGLCTAINAITVAVLLEAMLSEGPGLSENATQILTTAFGGIIGVLGSYVGYRAASSSRDAGQADAARAQLAAERSATPEAPT